MIVQCDQCNARFRLDDSKVKEGGVKVRCSKCKNIFVVQAEQPAEEADFDSFLSGLTPTAPGTADASPREETSTVVAAAEAGASQAEETSRPEPAGSKVAPVQEDFDLSEFTFDQEGFGAPPQAPSPEPAVKEAGDSVFGELDLGGIDLSGAPQEIAAPGAGAPQEFEFKEEPPAAPVPEFELDVEGLGMFGEPEKPAAPEPARLSEPGGSVAPPPPEEFSFEAEIPEQKTTPDLENFFAEASTDFPAATEGSVQPPPDKAEEKGETGQPTSFDFSDFDFGEGPAKEKVETPQEPFSLGPGPEEPPVYSQISAPPLPDMESFEEEAPPLSISSRRKGGGGLPVTVIAISAVLVLVLAGGGFYLFREGPSAFNKLGLGFMTKLFGSGSKEEGGILLRNTAGTFLNNKEVGEIFAVNGEAVNNFGKPRASIQVKATLYGPKGVVLLQKTAYCGNSLSREQLTTLPDVKLEAAMNNQFGDSLSNLAIQPGKAIPFAIVLKNVPKDVVEFGVEVVGSTVASQ